MPATVNLERITGTQPGITADGVEGYLRAASRRGRRTAAGDLPRILWTGEELYIIDGHHRLTAELALGHRTAKVMLLDLTMFV